MPVQDMAGLFYDRHRQKTYVVSDKLDGLIVFNEKIQIEKITKFPNAGSQEGIALFDNGLMAIADDLGYVTVFQSK